MRKLKTVLADGNPYTLSTLTLKEQSIARKLEFLPKVEQKEMEDLHAKMTDGKDMTDVESKRFDELQTKQIRNLLKIVMIALSKNHDQFKITAERTEDMILSSIEDLVDVRDTRRLSSFAILGTLPVDDDEDYAVEETIDLTGQIQPAV